MMHRKDKRPNGARKRLRAGELPGAVIIYIILGLFAFATLYPFVYVFSMSLSSPKAVLENSVLLWPVGFSLGSYKLIFENRSIFTAYGNTIWYALTGMTISTIVTLCAAYALSRKEFFLRNVVMLYVTVTMLFSGGMISLFIIVSRLGLYNTRWAIILPAVVTTYNLIIARTYFSSSIPESLPESAKIDGCNDAVIFARVILPVSKPILAVMILFYSITRWNSFFPESIYLSNTDLQPLQIFLRKILIMNSQLDILSGFEDDLTRLAYVQQIKYSIIIVSILPIICVYPLMQKYFVQGVMLGSIKG